MRTITVMDRNEAGAPGITLRDMLACIAPAAVLMRWQINDLECTGERAAELHAAADQGQWIAGAGLVASADGVDQVIDGEFLGYAPGGAAPTLVLRAVDGSSWDVTSNSEALLDAFRRSYRDVIEAGVVSG